MVAPGSCAGELEIEPWFLGSSAHGSGGLGRVGEPDPDSEVEHHLEHEEGVADRPRAPTGRLQRADKGVDVDQAVEDLGVEWRRQTRQRWVLDADEVAEEGGRRRPDLARRTEASLRIARLRAERDAVGAVAPEASDRRRILDARLRLEQMGQPAERHAIRRRE